MAWNGSDGKSTNGTSAAKRTCRTQSSSSDCRNASNARRLSYAVFAVLAVAVVVGVFLFLRSGTDNDATQKQQPAEPVAKAKSRPSAPKPVARVQEQQSEPEQSEPVEKPYYDTNKWHEVNGHLVPRGARLVENYLTNKVQRVFKYSTDDVILAYLLPGPGGTLPPMQPIMGGSDRIFLKSLEDPIVIDKDDSEEIRARKELVIVAREQIKARMDAGESFADILQDNYRLMEDNAKIRREAQREFDKIYREGDDDGARKYMLMIDAALQQMGIEGLKEPHPKLQKVRKRQDENAQ